MKPKTTNDAEYSSTSRDARACMRAIHWSIAQQILIAAIGIGLSIYGWKYAIHFAATAIAVSWFTAAVVVCRQATTPGFQPKRRHFMMIRHVCWVSFVGMVALHAGWGFSYPFFIMLLAILILLY